MHLSADAPIEHKGSDAKVEIAERPKFQNWFWGVQRLGWGGLGIAIALALAGLAGAGGPWSQRVSQSGATFISYPAILRVQRSETIKIRSDQHEMILPRTFLEVFDITSISPEPTGQKSIDRSLSLTFDGTGELMIVISVTPKKTSAKRHRLRMGVELHDLEITILP